MKKPTLIWDLQQQRWRNFLVEWDSPAARGCRLYPSAVDAIDIRRNGQLMGIMNTPKIGGQSRWIIWKEGQLGWGLRMKTDGISWVVVETDGTCFVGQLDLWSPNLKTSRHVTLTNSPRDARGIASSSLSLQLLLYGHIWRFP
jgi:hypothetical protein